MKSPFWGSATLSLMLLGSIIGRASIAQQPKAVGEPMEKPREQDAITNSIGMKLALIPADEFMMGNSHTIDEEVAGFEKPYEFHPFPIRWLEDQYPRHRVRISKSFYLGAHEVTIGQFRRFCDDTAYKTDAEKVSTKWGVKWGVGWDPEKNRFPSNANYSWRHVGFPQTDEHPVVNVSWNDAVAFCEWLSEKEGAAYRLPTEAEWEYACRAGTITRYYNGDDPEMLVQVGNVVDATAKAQFPGFEHGIRASDGYVFTAPVGRFRPNAFGLYDMHGNVREWCSDWYAKAYYTNSPSDDPSGADSGKYRVVRGGSWYECAWKATSAFRTMCEPEFRSFETGFRVARTRQAKQ